MTKIWQHLTDFYLTRAQLLDFGIMTRTSSLHKDSALIIKKWIPILLVLKTINSLWLEWLLKGTIIKQTPMRRYVNDVVLSSPFEENTETSVVLKTCMQMTSLKAFFFLFQNKHASEHNVMSIKYIRNLTEMLM